MAYTSMQVRNIKAVIAQGKKMGASTRDIKIALITAAVETNFRTGASVWKVDHDSIGLFQQRSRYYAQEAGGEKKLDDPYVASRLFYKRLLALGGRTRITMGEAAQAVQRSAFPGRYQTRVPEADRIWAKYGLTPPGSGSGGSTPAAATTAATIRYDTSGPTSSTRIAPSSVFAPRTAVEKILFRGAKFYADLRDAVTDASVDMGIGKTSEISLSIYDPGFRFLSSGLFTRPGYMDFQDLRQELVSVETGAAADGNGLVTVRARSMHIGILKRRRGPLVIRQSSPSTFVERECKAAGARYLIQPSAKRTQVSRDVPKAGESTGSDYPSSWTTFQRLATELGFVCFEIGGKVYFGKPSWLLTHTPDDVKVTYRKSNDLTDVLGVPNFRDSEDAEEGVTVDFVVPTFRAQHFRPGRKVLISGFPRYAGSYLITDVSYSLVSGGGVAVSARLPRGADPTPQPPEANVASSASTGAGGSSGSSGGSSGSPTNATGTKSALDFTTLALKQSGDRYVFGAEVRRSDPDPDAFDCSELTEWLAARMGVYLPDGAINQYGYCRTKRTLIGVKTALKVRGALMFKTTSQGSSWPYHVAISLGSGGRTIEAVGREYGVRTMGPDRSFHWNYAGLVPGLTYATKFKRAEDGTLVPVSF